MDVWNTLGSRCTNVAGSVRFVQRLPNPNAMDVWNTLGSRCTNIAGSVKFVQRLPNVFQTPWTFGTPWIVVVQMSLVHWVWVLSLLCLYISFFNFQAVRMCSIAKGLLTFEMKKICIVLYHYSKDPYSSFRKSRLQWVSNAKPLDNR